MTAKLAVIGIGLIGKKHAELIRANDSCTLVGVCDVNPDLKTVADELDVPFYRDAETLIKREKPEGAIIATPNDLHAAVFDICAKHGVHVLIEKPIAGTLDEAHHIVKTADANGTQVLVGHHRRHNPLIQKAYALVNDGMLGKLVAVLALWALLKPAGYYRVAWRCKPPAGGPTLINLIHDIDSLRFICGEIREVYAKSNSDVRKLEVEDSLSITLSFENGALGSILASDATPSPWSYEATTRENPYYFHMDENCYHFLGTLGSLAFPKMEIWHYPDQELRGWQHPIDKKHIKVDPADPLVRQLEHFCRVVKGKDKPMVNSRDGTRSLAVALAVLESIRHLIPITVSSDTLK